MIDPAQSLAFSMQASRGVYAIFLGSGVSRAARIPTGWEITLDLIRKLAALNREPCDPDPASWYATKFRKAGDYSALLDELAKTPSERQQLLRRYWEPSDQEREDGAKQPTQAHRAIAALVAQGFVKVVVTTNFDRLLEGALVEADVVPTVLSSPDQVQGALPLIHTQCCVFKIHGDYLDTRIRNTPEELSSYPPEFEELLARIFDEFGLIVCGWSAEWDTALRKAMERIASRRFATYWAVRGELGDEARRLVNHRGAQLVRITDADSFFKSLQENVESLSEFSRPHPLSTEAAVASLKRYLGEPKFRIQLSDLVDDVVDRVIATTSGTEFSVRDSPTPNPAQATARVRRYEAASSTLLAMAPYGGFWAEEEHFSVWQRALERLSSRKEYSGFDFWIDLQAYPGTLLLYAVGLGAVTSGRLQFLRRLLDSKVYTEGRDDKLIVELLPPSNLFRQGGQVARLLDGMERHHVPLNDWLHSALRPSVSRLIPNDATYTYAFDRLEMLIALSYARQTQQEEEGYWAPFGAFGYRTQSRDRFLREIEESLSTNEARSPFVECGMLGESVEACRRGLTAFKSFAATLNHRFSW